MTKVLFRVALFGFALSALAQATPQPLGETKVSGAAETPAPALEIEDPNSWPGANGWGNNLKITAPNFPALRFFPTGTTKSSMIGNHGDGSLWFAVNGTSDVPGGLALVIDPNGRIGAGISEPLAKLHIDGGGEVNATTNILLRNVPPSDVFGGTSLQFANRATGGGDYSWRINTAGNITSTSGLSANGFEVWEYAPGAAATGRLKVLKTATLAQPPSPLVIDGYGSLGIGSSPTYGRLFVAGNSATTNTAGVGTSYTGLVVSNLIDSTVVLRNLGGGHSQLSTDVAGRYLSFATGEFQERVRITADGAVGVGTSAPAAGTKLHVAGSSTIDGNVGIGAAPSTHRLYVNGSAYFVGAVTGSNIQAHYQDVAEWVAASENIPDGSVVALDDSALKHVRLSRRPYDTAVAGVVSPEPGILLGEGGEGKVKVATTGRVKVRVDASKHPIAVGDLLVTSDKPGIAMKSIPVNLGGVEIHRPGTIIGKAIEPLASGEGEILVLLSLQ